jgi:ribonucleoside-diphosphate reductase alpha chain
MKVAQHDEIVWSNPLSQANMISDFIWRIKYKSDRPGLGEEQSLRSTFRRVSEHLCGDEPDSSQFGKKLERLFARFVLLPGGRIIANADLGPSRTLLNTFVIGRVSHDVLNLTAKLRETLQTMRMGGGIGCDFSDVAPEPEGPGPVAVMKVWDQACEALLSSRSGRGAMMAVLACDHPDILSFIRAKRQAGSLTRFNVSVLITDDFVAAAIAREPWPLRFRGRVTQTVQARALWDEIIVACYESAEPGVIFIDRVSERNKLGRFEEIVATNSCAEQPLPRYGGAPLASINLAAMVKAPFSPSAHIDFEQMAEAIEAGVRMLDNSIDHTHYPLPEQALEARRTRRVGLGFTGLADALAMHRAAYGSPESLHLVRSWLEAFRRQTHAASIALAKARGAFPLFDDEYANQPHFDWMDPDQRATLRRHGIRNGVLNSVAPTGSISLLAGNVSSGVEPIFLRAYHRQIRLANGEPVTVKLSSYSIELFEAMFPDQPLPDYFVTADDIDPGAHVIMQGLAQSFVDGAISKTVNCPDSISYDEFAAIYADAYSAGCKSISAFRPSALRGAVLTPA